MAARKKPATTAKKTNTTAKKTTHTKRTTAQKSGVDPRWSIALFGVGVVFVLLSVLPGESAWAWIRSYLLFGTFGISGWLLGPFLIYLAVMVGLGKPIASHVIKGILFFLAFSGAALVFNKTDFSYLKGQGVSVLLKALIESGRSSAIGGGLISLFLGYSLLAVAGRTAARALLVILVVVTVMVFTGVTPADIYYFIADHFGKSRQKRQQYYDEYEDEYDDEPIVTEKPVATRKNAASVNMAPPPSPALVKAPKRCRKSVDIDLGPDIPLSEPGLGENDEVQVGPGGTFGLNPLAPKVPEQPANLFDDNESPLEPFNPHSTQSLFDQADSSDGNTMLLFGQDDPYASLGGAESKIPPGNVFDVEYMPAAVPPAAAPEFDLFGRKSAPAPVQFEKEPELDIFANAVAAPPAIVPETVPTSPQNIFEQPAIAEAGSETSGASADPTVAAMIDKAATIKDEKINLDASRPMNGLFAPYKYPPVSLFTPPMADDNVGARDEMQKTADLLVSTLSSFGVQTRILDVSRGPTVTRYEIQPQAGVKISRITNLADDIALNLAAAGVRIEAPIPGKPAVGIEVPNRKKSMVSIRSILETPAFANSKSALSIALGKDIAGEAIVADLTKMPHMLVAGSTGSGKSVCINATIMSFLYKSSPEDVRLLLIDPKVVELAEYNGIPHLLMPVVTEPRKAAGALGAMVAEMEKRYRQFAENNVRDIRTFNKLAERVGELEKLPYIAIVIDELADLMMTAGKEVEDYICRIAQKARAAGMHLIVATQRPSVDVITGLIKANIPSRIAFAVSSQVDSRTILDGAGAEKLLGMGDMLFMPVGANKPVRVQGTYVKDEEISDVLNFIKQSGEAQYDESMIEAMERNATQETTGESSGNNDDVMSDPVFISAVEIALEMGQVSTSFLQRRLRLGYARASRMADTMEQLHIVSPQDGSKPRQLLITRQQWLEMSMNSSDKQ